MSILATLFSIAHVANSQVATNTDLQGAINRAVWHLKLEQARVLLKQGLRPQSIDIVVDGRDREPERLAMLDLLAEYTYDFLAVQQGTWSSAAKRGSPRVVAWLLDHGLPLEPLINRWLPLHHAITENEVDVVELLLKRGASATDACMDRRNVASFNEQLKTGQANYRYDSGNNSVCEYPLQVAARAGNWRAIEVLLKHGSKINFEDFEGETALHCAAQRPDNKEVIRFLVVNGADRRILSRIGETPLQVAQRLKFDSNVKALLRP